MAPRKSQDLGNLNLADSAQGLHFVRSPYHPEVSQRRTAAIRGSFSGAPRELHVSVLGCFWS